jgi:cytochrome d ubiquinol oxidase subunit I
MRTEDAVTDGNWVWWTLTAMIIVYALLGLAGGAVLRSMTRRWAAGEHDLASPYGPSMDELDAARTDRAEVPA